MRSTMYYATKSPRGSFQIYLDRQMAYQDSAVVVPMYFDKGIMMCATHRCPLGRCNCLDKAALKANGKTA